MKKTFKTFTLMLLTALAFSSCVDVPVPYNLPSKKGSTSIVPEGEGTLASPYNVAAIIEKISEMEANVESTEEYYIKGKVSKVTTTAQSIEQYGNHTFEMIDEGNSSVVFTAYQVYGPGKQKFTSINDIRVGDDVVVCGRVVNYKGNTPETVGKGEAYVVSINGSGEGGESTEDEGTTITCAEAVNLTQKLADGATSTETYSIVGYITDTDGKVSRNQQVFWMADTKDGGKIFEAYWADLPEGVTAFTVGMKVKITGKLMKFVNNSGNVTCEMKNPKVVILTDDGSDKPVVDGTAVTCAEAVQLTQALAEGGTSTETYTITGYITEVVSSVSRNQQSFWMADTKDGGRVFNAYWANLPDGVTEFKVGMKVSITGNLLKYVKDGAVTPEIKNATVVVLEDGDGGGTTPPAIDAIPVTCAEAVQLTSALTDGGTSTDTYAVTGYITEVISSVSRNQQSFWMADTKDGGNVFEAYWADLPTGVSEFKVGMKVTITGKLMKYVKDGAMTPEIKNATVVILEEGDGGQGGDGGDGGDTPPTPGVDPVTELENGNFESWESDTEATGWKPSGSTSGPGSAVYSQSRDSHEGAYACLVTADEGNNKRLATQEITLEAGTYVFSFYAKSATAPSAQTRIGYVPIKSDGTTDSYKYNSSFFDINNNGWTLVENEFTLSAKTTVCLIIMNPKSNTAKGYTAQDILVDDATLVKK